MEDQTEHALNYWYDNIGTPSDSEENLYVLLQRICAALREHATLTQVGLHEIHTRLSAVEEAQHE